MHTSASLSFYAYIGRFADLCKASRAKATALFLVIKAQEQYQSLLCSCLHMYVVFEKGIAFKTTHFC